MKKIFDKCKWLVVIILVLIIAYPIICLFINKIKGLNLGELYTFDLSLKEFMPIWVAFWGVIGAAIGIWQVQRRIIMQEKQQINSHKQFNKQIDKQNEQIQIQQKQLRDNRFSAGVELLGNQNESTRIGGAYNLYFLATEYPDEYLEPVCEILCAHIRTITSNKKYKEDYEKNCLLLKKEYKTKKNAKHSDFLKEKYKKNIGKLSNEVETILNLIFKKNKKDTELIFNNCYKNMQGSFLCGTDFSKSTLNWVNFCGADLDESKFTNTELNRINFSESLLNDVDFSESKLNNVIFFDSQLSKIRFNKTELSHVNFRLAKLSEVGFYETELNHVSFQIAKLSEVIFNKTKLSKVYFSFSDGELIELIYMPAKLNEVKFYNVELSEVHFNYTQLNKVEFLDAKLSMVEFHNAILNDVDFGYSFSISQFMLNDLYQLHNLPTKLSNVDFRNAELNNVNFNNAKLEEVSFAETILENYSYEEITTRERSLELTKEKKEIKLGNISNPQIVK